MTITLNLSPILGFACANPWATVGLVFLLCVVLPGVWSRRRWRRRAAMTVIRTIGETVTAIANTARGGRLP